MNSILDSLDTHQESALSFQLRRARIQFRFLRRFGHFVDFENPRIFQEKTQFRKLFGNHALYALLADKHRVRDFVRERVGDRYLIEQFGVYDRLTADVFDELPDAFIIKANHGCKWHKIVRDKSKLNIRSTVRYFNRLMHRYYGGSSAEYHYRLIEPKVVIEELLLERDDSPPDYNFFCFHHQSQFRYSLAISTPHGKRNAFFDDQWDFLGGSCTPEEVERYARPKNFDEMLSVAERLSAGFDFLRIDLYNVDGQIYFGEVTCTPAAGFKKIKSRLRAERQNALWKLDKENGFLYRRRLAA